METGNCTILSQVGMSRFLTGVDRCDLITKPSIHQYCCVLLRQTSLLNCPAPRKLTVPVQTYPLDDVVDLLMLVVVADLIYSGLVRATTSPCHPQRSSELEGLRWQALSRALYLLQISFRRFRGKLGNRIQQHGLCDHHRGPTVLLCISPLGPLTSTLASHL